MEHRQKSRARIKNRCAYARTAAGVVKGIYINLAAIDVTPEGVSLIEMIPGMGWKSCRL